MKKIILLLLMAILPSIVIKATGIIRGNETVYLYEVSSYKIYFDQSEEIVASSFTWKIKNGKIRNPSTGKFDLDALKVYNASSGSMIDVTFTSADGGELQFYTNGRTSNLYASLPIEAYYDSTEVKNLELSTPLNFHYIAMEFTVHDCTINNGGTLFLWGKKSIKISPPFKAYRGSTVTFKTGIIDVALPDTSYREVISTPTSMTKKLSRWVDPQETISSSVIELGSSSLGTNTPNPFTESSVISCYIPKSANSAQILIFDVAGNAIKKINLADRGNISITINASDFSKGGTYCYALLLNGKFAGSKKMQVIK